MQLSRTKASGLLVRCALLALYPLRAWTQLGATSEPAARAAMHY